LPPLHSSFALPFLGLLNAQGTGPPAQAPFGGIENIEPGIGSSEI
jgi:hypothetical protein